MEKAGVQGAESGQEDLIDGSVMGTLTVQGERKGMAMSEANDPRNYILNLVDWESTNGYKTTDLVVQWCNAEQADIDEYGDVWVSGSTGGNWLNDDKLAEFVEWHKLMV
jgi:hypothetical protein